MQLRAGNMTSSVAQTNSIADIAVKWDNAYRNKDVDSLSALLAPDVVVHYAGTYQATFSICSESPCAVKMSSRLLAGKVRTGFLLLVIVKLCAGGFLFTSVRTSFCAHH